MVVLHAIHSDLCKQFVRNIYETYVGTLALDYKLANEIVAIIKAAANAIKDTKFKGAICASGPSSML